jgi:hypothetical protein
MLRNGVFSSLAVVFRHAPVQMFNRYALSFQPEFVPVGLFLFHVHAF